MNNSRLAFLVLAGLLTIGLVLFFTRSKNTGSSGKKDSVAMVPVPAAGKAGKQHVSNTSMPAKPSKSVLDKMRAKLIDLREKAGIDPHHAMRWIAIAKVYNNMGDYYKACQYLEKSLEMEPKFKFRGAVEVIIEQCNKKYPGLSNP